MKATFLTISAIASVICWYFIFHSRDPWYVKIILAIVAAIPGFGPFFYFLVLRNTPPVKPKEKQAKMSHRLGINYARNYDPVPDEDENQEKGG